MAILLKGAVFYVVDFTNRSTILNSMLTVFIVEFHLTVIACIVANSLIELQIVMLYLLTTNVYYMSGAIT